MERGGRIAGVKECMGRNEEWREREGGGREKKRRKEERSERKLKK